MLLSVQVVVLIITLKVEGLAPLYVKNMLRFVVLFQYIPRLLRIIPLYKEVTRSAGIMTETAWAGAALNLFLYMLASHVSTIIQVISFYSYSRMLVIA